FANTRGFCETRAIKQISDAGSDSSTPRALQTCPGPQQVTHGAPPAVSCVPFIPFVYFRPFRPPVPRQNPTHAPSRRQTDFPRTGATPKPQPPKNKPPTSKKHPRAP